MSVAFSTRIYGAIEGSAPFADGNGATAFSRVLPFSTVQVQNLPSASVNVVGLPNGFQMPSGAYVYSVIQVPPTGLNVHGDQFVVQESAATLATLRG